ncbi:MAG: response regulator, partial [Limisphaerales bacterium]
MNRKKLLVADDNEFIVRSLAMKLEACGYEVVVALDGATVVSLARQERPDLLLLDINFPPDVAHGGGIAWDGFLIINWLRRMDEVKDIPIIIMTQSDPELYRERAAAANAIGLFQKPLDLTALLNLIAEA